MSAEKKPNTDFRTAPFIRNAGRIVGGHTQPIQTPPLLAILSRRKTRKGIHWRGATGFPWYWSFTSKEFLLHYHGGCHLVRPVVFNKSQYPTVYWWKPTKLTMNPKELKWSKFTYRLPPRRVAAMVDYHTRLTHWVL